MVYSRWAILDAHVGPFCVQKWDGSNNMSVNTLFDTNPARISGQVERKLGQLERKMRKDTPTNIRFSKNEIQP